MNRLGQQWSFEVILSIALFVVVFVFAISFIIVLPESGTRDLEVQTVTLMDEVSSSSGFVQNEEVDVDRLNIWYNITKEEEGLENLKTQLGLVDDFCIFFLDENQNLVPLSFNSTEEYYGIGDGTITLGNTTCGQIS